MSGRVKSLQGTAGEVFAGRKVLTLAVRMVRQWTSVGLRARVRRVRHVGGNSEETDSDASEGRSECEVTEGRLDSV